MNGRLLLDCESFFERSIQKLRHQLRQWKMESMEGDFHQTRVSRSKKLCIFLRVFLQNHSRFRGFRKNHGLELLDDHYRVFGKRWLTCLCFYLLKHCYNRSLNSIGIETAFTMHLNLLSVLYNFIRNPKS